MTVAMRVNLATGELIACNTGMNVDVSVDGSVTTRLVGSLGIVMHPAPPPSTADPKSKTAKDKPTEEDGTVTAPPGDSAPKAEKGETPSAKEAKQP